MTLVDILLNRKPQERRISERPPPAPMPKPQVRPEDYSIGKEPALQSTQPKPWWYQDDDIGRCVWPPFIRVEPKSLPKPSVSDSKPAVVRIRLTKELDRPKPKNKTVSVRVKTNKLDKKIAEVTDDEIKVLW